MLLKLVSDPHGFVERQSKYPGITTQSIIVLAAGIAFGLWHFGSMVLIGDASEYVTRSQWLIPIVNILVGFGLWIVISAVLYFLAQFIQAYFPIEVIFRLVGYGMAPIVVAGLIQSIGMVYALQDVAPPNEPELSGFSYEYAEYLSYIDGGLSDPVFLGATILAVPFVLYAGYVWSLAVAHLGEVDLKSAFMVAALPTAVCLIWLAHPFLL